MDTTETYIKMRLAAIPNMGMGTPMGFSINWQSSVILVDEKGDWYYSTKDESTQLERQDQLQEMVRDKFQRQVPFEIICSIHKWGSENLLAQYKSMEQLWLAFVMKVKHNKVWNGDEWKLSS